MIITAGLNVGDEGWAMDTAASYSSPFTLSNPLSLLSISLLATHCLTPMPGLHIPYEVLACIIDAVPVEDTSTLATLLRVCRVTYALAAPRLYSSLCITDTNLPAVLRGLTDVRDDQDGSQASSYPNAESDARKRALLKYTTMLQVRSVPVPDIDSDDDLRIFTICPMDRSTFPAVKEVLVYAPVPYHHEASMAKLRARSRTPSPRLSP